jgi:hypothetical protein
MSPAGDRPAARGCSSRPWDARADVVARRRYVVFECWHLWLECAWAMFWVLGTRGSTMVANGMRAAEGLAHAAYGNSGSIGPPALGLATTVFASWVSQHL